MLSKKEKDFIEKEFSADEQSDANKIFPLMKAADSKSFLITFVLGALLATFVAAIHSGLAIGVIILTVWISWLLWKKRDKVVSKYNQIVEKEPDNWVSIINKVNEFEDR